MRFFVLPLLGLIAFPALAEEGAMVQVDSSVCLESADYVPSRDTAYVPGRDVDGKPVVSADVDDSDFGDDFAETVTVTLKEDLAQRLGIPTGPLNAEAQIGTLSRGKNNELLLNGKSLGRKNTRELCRQLGAAR